MFVRPMVVVAVLVSLFSLKVFAEDTTETSLSRYGDGLAAAWAQYPSEKDAIVRKQRCTDLNTAINADLNKVSAPENITIQKAVDNFQNNLQKVRTLFKQEKMSGERQQYVSASQSCFRRELTFVIDGKDERTASKCFEELVSWCENARTGLSRVPEDVHQPYYQGLSDAFNLMLKSATKDAGDPTSIYDQHLKEVKRKFPVTNPIFQKTNQPIASVLEAAAKNVNNLNKK